MNASTRRVMFSSENDKWSTPQDFYDKLDSEFNFTLDPCCTPESSKCYTFFTEEDDGLIQDWKGHTVFMNPPYGRSLRHWIRKAFEEGLKENTVVVALIPSRTDTRYWHEYCMKAKEIRFVKGRLKFGNSQNGAPFPSAVVIFDGHCPPRIETL